MEIRIVLRLSGILARKILGYFYYYFLLMNGYLFYTNSSLVLGVETMKSGSFSFFSIIWLISNMWICKKAGKPMWSQLIPLYNVAVLLEIVGFNPFLVVLLFVPFINIGFALFLLLIFPIYLSYSFGKGILFGMGLIFFPILFYPMLAFSSCRYIGEEKEKLDNREKDPQSYQVKQEKKIKTVCPYCGIQLEEENKKCFLCGKKIR